ncbi:GNAT family N-acetyltransferase [Domibacillus indicus]|uniref:GNAT family N-acetyltransferase n=1 Tax=Domibacillus indicus TaxID=1437523 RepID=UPI000695B532|nr:N-acetyltransferase [Domibacillus indicus]
MHRTIINLNKDIQDIAVLLMEGFAGKFQTLKLPKREHEYLLHCLAEHILKKHRENLLVIRDKSIQGILLIKPKKWYLREFSNLLLKQLSFKSFVKALLFFGALHHDKKENEIHIDFITVSEASRGAGVGTKLIELVKNSAGQGQFITLYVSKTNTAARKLYERLGFRIKKEGASKVGRHLHGINQWYFMEWKGSNTNEKER